MTFWEFVVIAVKIGMVVGVSFGVVAYLIFVEREDRRLGARPARAEPGRPVRSDPADRRRRQDAPQGRRDAHLRRQADLHHRPGDRHRRGDDRLRGRAIRPRGCLGPDDQRLAGVIPDRAGGQCRDRLHPFDRQPRGLRDHPGGLGVEQQILVPGWAPVERPVDQL